MPKTARDVESEPCNPEAPCTVDVPCLVHVVATSDRTLREHHEEIVASDLGSTPGEIDMAGPDDLAPFGARDDERPWGLEHLHGFRENEGD